MKKTVLITILLVLAILFCFADELDVDFSMDAETKLGLRAPWTDPTVYSGRFTLADTLVTTKIGVYYGDFSAFTEYTYNYCRADSLNSLFKKNIKDESTDSDGRTFSMNEFWADYSSSFWGIRIGRQKAAWGKADGIDITNVLCPTDMSSFAAMTSDNSKLSIDAIRLSFNGDSFTADAWWIPVFTPSALPLDESNHLRKLLVPQSVDFPIPMLNTVLKLPVKIGELEKPEKKIQNGEFGLKLSGYFSILDVSLYGFYGWDDIPLLNYGITFGQPQFPFPAMPDGLEVSGKYERMAMLGADAALPIGETVIRMEAAFFPKRHFQKEAESILSSGSNFSEQRNELSALIGIDWMPNGWTFTAQYFCDYVAGKLDSLERTDKYTHGATFSVSKTFLDETLEASFSGVINFDVFDTMFAPSVKYSVSDQLSISGGSYIFLGGPGGRDGQYGKYRDLSTFFISAKFSM